MSNPGGLKTHGMSTKPVGSVERRAYAAWIMMRQRCTNPNTTGFDNYGGRGVTYDPRWNSFEVFLADVGLPPSINHSLDRKDGSQGYTTDNVKWSTRLEQQSNLRSNKRITCNGLTLTLAQWARRLGITRATFHSRVKKYGAEKAVNFVPYDMYAPRSTETRQKMVEAWKRRRARGEVK